MKLWSIQNWTTFRTQVCKFESLKTLQHDGFQTFKTNRRFFYTTSIIYSFKLMNPPNSDFGNIFKLWNLNVWRSGSLNVWRSENFESLNVWSLKVPGPGARDPTGGPSYGLHLESPYKWRVIFKLSIFQALKFLGQGPGAQLGAQAMVYPWRVVTRGESLPDFQNFKLLGQGPGPNWGPKLWSTLGESVHVENPFQTFRISFQPSKFELVFKPSSFQTFPYGQFQTSAFPKLKNLRVWETFISYPYILIYSIIAYIVNHYIYYVYGYTISVVTPIIEYITLY